MPPETWVLAPDLYLETLVTTRTRCTHIRNALAGPTVCTRRPDNIWRMLTSRFSRQLHQLILILRAPSAPSCPSLLRPAIPWRPSYLIVFHNSSIVATSGIRPDDAIFVYAVRLFFRLGRRHLAKYIVSGGFQGTR